MLFRSRRRQLTDEQIRQYESEGRPHVIRFAMPVKEYRFTDVVLGKEIVLSPQQVQDFVIRKADGMPTYHFGVVVDDTEEWTRKLEAMGAPCIQGPGQVPQGSHAEFKFRGPDGVVFDITGSAWEGSAPVDDEMPVAAE